MVPERFGYTMITQRIRHLRKIKRSWMMCHDSSLDFTEEKPPDKAGEEGQAHALHHNKRRSHMHCSCRPDRMVAATGRTAGSYVLHRYICVAGGGL